MFDIGFWELMIIGLVALVVVGPERLPKLAYTAGKWLGKGRSMISAVKSEIDKEIKSEELKDALEKQKKALNPLADVVEETNAAVRDMKNSTGTAMRDAQQEHGSEDESYTRFGDSASPSDNQSNDSRKETSG
ncbi:MAG: twin-arginine translocase subunit TatB [Gammaproteobacteria bacterium]|nr:twin-arginine translocase subunit TatB [Gammaproteobacteria bacterium]